MDATTGAPNVLLSALTTSQYTKLSNFPDKPIPPELQPKQFCLQPNIHDLLAHQNRIVKPIVGDGNCFFRALSDIIYSSQEHQEHHNLVRTEIVEHIAQNPTQFAPLLIQKFSIDEHLATIRLPGKWATQVDIQTASELYGTPLYLYTLTPSTKHYHWLCFTPKSDSTPRLTHHIELAHPGRVHFEVDVTTCKPSLTSPQLI